MKFIDVLTRLFSVAATLLGTAAMVLVLTSSGGRGPRGHNGTSIAASITPKFKTGDIVRIIGGQKAFGVGCRQNFSRERFKITDVYKGKHVVYGLWNDDWKFYEREKFLE